MARRAMLNSLRRYDWRPVTVGESDAMVHHLHGPDQLFLKQAVGPAAQELLGEAERTQWLGSTGIPAADVLDYGIDEDGAWLLTAAVPGQSLAQPWPGADPTEVARSVAQVLAALHAQPDCPFRRDLQVVIPAALDNARAGRVDTEDLDADRAGWSLDHLCAELERTVPGQEDLVVAHGDFCAPNILVDPRTAQVTALVDLGRLGWADRHQDLALFDRSVSDGVRNPDLSAEVSQVFGSAYGAELDEDRVAFYRLLDEFF